MNDNSSLTHPLVLKAAKKCKDCHYTMTSASMRRIYDPHTKERIATSKVVFAHKNKDLPLPIHQFIRSEMTKQNANGHISKTGEVSLHVKKLPEGGHELHFHAVKISK